MANYTCKLLVEILPICLTQCGLEFQYLIYI